MTAITHRLKPTEHFCTSANFTGFGLHPSAGHSSEGSGDCTSYLDEGQDALDETDYGVLRSRALAGIYTTGRFEHTFGSLPSGLTISKVRVIAYLRTSNAGTEIIDEPPRVKGFVNLAGTRYYQSGPSYVMVTQACNRNTHAAADTFARYVCGEWATNPATAAAWTLEDLAAGVFKAGVEAGGIAEGQAGNGVPPTTGGTQASLDAAVIELEVDATSTDLIVEPIRTIITRLLRLRRRALKPVTLDVPAPLAHARPGKIVYCSDPFWPTPGAAGLSPLDWDRRPLWVQDVEERVSAHSATLVGLDLREHYALMWSPLHTDLGADDQWTGLAYMDQGAGKAIVRAQGGWIWRPGDGLWRDAATGKWRITPWGLLVCGGTYAGSVANTGETTWHTLNNTLSQGVGGEGTSLPNADAAGFTSWTVAKNGAATVVIKVDSSYLFDVSGYRRAARLTNGTPHAGNNCSLSQAVAGFATTQRVRVGIKFRMVSGNPANMRFRLNRTTAPADWSEAANAWVAAPYQNTLADGGPGRASFRKVGDHYEYWSTDIVVGGAGAQTLTLALVSPAEDAASVDVFAGGIISTGTALGAASRVMRREWIATQGVAIAQAGDIVDLYNPATTMSVLDRLRGTFTAFVTPLWDHEDLSDGATKPVATFVHHYFSGYLDKLYYQRIDATTGKWVFSRTVFAGAVTAEIVVTAAAGTLPRNLTPVALSARWTSSTGELGLVPRSVTVHVNGVASAAAVAAGDPSYSASYVALGRETSGAVGSVSSPASFLDGMIAHVEILPFCLSDLEIARRHAQLSLPALPVAV